MRDQLFNPLTFYPFARLLRLTQVAVFTFAMAIGFAGNATAQGYDLTFENQQVTAGESFRYPFLGMWTNDVIGFTLAVQYSVTSSLNNLQITINDTLSGELLPEFTHYSISALTGEITFGLLFEAQPPFTNETLPPLPFPIAMVNLEGDANPGSEGEIISFQYLDGLGTPPINNIFVDYDTLVSVPADTFGSGTLMIVAPIIDPPDPIFTRGDVNQDGQMDIADVLFTLNYSFGDGSVPPCQDAADVNDDGHNDISDAIFLLDFLFGGGPVPLFPYFSPGADPSLDALGCEMPPL